MAAFVMKPVQIRIADKAARSAITKYSDQTEYKPEPKIAYIKENHISVTQIEHDTAISADRLECGNGKELDAVEFLELCSYLNVSPERFRRSE